MVLADPPVHQRREFGTFPLQVPTASLGIWGGGKKKKKPDKTADSRDPVPLLFLHGSRLPEIPGEMGNGIRWALWGTNGHFGAQIDTFGYKPFSEPHPGCGAAHPGCGVTPGTDPWAAAVPFGFRAVPAVPGQINPRGAGIGWREVLKLEWSPDSLRG